MDEIMLVEVRNLVALSGLSPVEGVASSTATVDALGCSRFYGDWKNLLQSFWELVLADRDEYLRPAVDKATEALRILAAHDKHHSDLLEQAHELQKMLL